MNVLMSGGTGRVGTLIAAELSKTHKLRILGRTSPPSHYQFFEGDIRNFKDIVPAMENVDTVVHLAATLAGKDPILTLDVNVKGTYNLLQAAVNSDVKKVVFASSIAAIGCLTPGYQPQYLPIDENHPCESGEVYGFSKMIGEQMCKTYTRQYGLKTICLRIGAVSKVGEGALDDGNSGVSAVIWGGVDARDVCQAIRLSVDDKEISHAVFNITAEDTLSQEKSLNLANKYYSTVKILPNENLFIKGDERRSFFTIARAKKELNWRPQYRLGNLTTRQAIRSESSE